MAKKTVNPSVTSTATPCFCRKFSSQVRAIVFVSVMPGGGINVSSTAFSTLWGEVNGLDYVFLAFLDFFFFTGLSGGMGMLLPGKSVSNEIGLVAVFGVAASMASI